MSSSERKMSETERKQAYQDHLSRQARAQMAASMENFFAQLIGNGFPGSIPTVATVVVEKAPWLPEDKQDYATLWGPKVDKFGVPMIELALDRYKGDSKAITSKFECSVCKNICNLWVSLPCAHPVCARCVERIPAPKTKCPQCRKVSTDPWAPQHQMRAEFAKLRAECCNAGCDFDTEIGFDFVVLKKHIAKDCKHGARPCDKCRQPIAPGQAAEHAKECQKKTCPHCDTKMHASDYDDHLNGKGTSAQRTAFGEIAKQGYHELTRQFGATVPIPWTPCKGLVFCTTFPCFKRFQNRGKTTLIEDMMRLPLLKTSEIDQHEKMYHSRPTDQKQPASLKWECDLCKASFDSIHDLGNHLADPAMGMEHWRRMAMRCSRDHSVCAMLTRRLLGGGGSSAPPLTPQGGGAGSGSGTGSGSGESKSGSGSGSGSGEQEETKTPAGGQGGPPGPPGRSLDEALEESAGMPSPPRMFRIGPIPEGQTSLGPLGRFAQALAAMHDTAEASDDDETVPVQLSMHMLVPLTEPEPLQTDASAMGSSSSSSVSTGAGTGAGSGSGSGAGAGSAEPSESKQSSTQSRKRKEGPGSKSKGPKQKRHKH